MRRIFAFALVLIFAAMLVSGPALAVDANYISANFSKGAIITGYSGVTCNSTYAGAIRYNSGTKAVEFCNGTSWTTLVMTQTSGLTAPAGSGYFVMSKGTYTGALGGPTGADATCLSDLTTNTGWMGYATANSNGQLVASKVHAFLCPNSSTCTDPMPLTTYYFADANNAAAGGASFTTNAGSVGPNDSNPWSAANYFSGSYTYWTGRSSAGGSNTQWATAGSGNNCNSFFSASGFNGITAISNATDANRWTSSSSGCATALHLICFVDP